MDSIRFVEVLAIPILMLCDYYLTLIGNKYRFEGYTNHFEVKNYELNPIWVKDVNKHKLFNIKHLFSVLTATLFVFYLNYSENYSIFYKVLYGAILTTFILVISRHISNILLFRFIRNNPGEIMGQVALSEKYIYTQSAIQYFACAIILVPLALLSRSFYVYGALVGCVFISIVQLVWLRRKLKNKGKVFSVAV